MCGWRRCAYHARGHWPGPAAAEGEDQWRLPCSRIWGWSESKRKLSERDHCCSVCRPMSKVAMLLCSPGLAGVIMLFIVAEPIHRCRCDFTDIPKITQLSRRMGGSVPGDARPGRPTT